ncbi:MAG TPA: CopD family protein, partial [Aggregatilineales bacterium]|nr:CopD family protein [Aggregatilineales bacterium]
VTRWIGYLALALLMGGFAFVPLVLRPSGIESHAPALDRLLTDSWLVLLIVTILAALVEAATASGGDPLAANGLGALLFTTRYGLIFWLRLALIAALGLLLRVREARVWAGMQAGSYWLTGCVLCALTLFTTSLNSHAAATPQPPLPVAADWLHLLFAGVWMGGLVALIMTLVASQPAQTTALLVARFSQLATVCVAGIAVTGLIQGFFEVVNLDNLIDTAYGLTLLLKSALLLPLLATAAINLLVVKRRMQQATTVPEAERAIFPWRRLILKTVAVEIALVTAIFLVTGILTTLPPAHEAFGSGSVVRGQAGDVRILLAANPGLPGLNTFDIYLKGQLDRPLNASNFEKVALIFSMREHDMGDSEADAVPVGNSQDGHFVAQGGHISMIGTWVIQVLIRRSGQDDVRTELTMPIVSINQLPTSPVLVAPSRALSGLEIMIVGLLLYLIGRRLKRMRTWANGLGAALASLALLLGLTVTASAFAVGMYAIPVTENPIPADAASLARGQDIYVKQCLACHGDNGAGDGFAGRFLKPPPTNFHSIIPPGPSDGQLFDWIARGMEGSSMPGFGENLTDAQRWDAINYIRTFVGKP